MDPDPSPPSPEPPALLKTYKWLSPLQGDPEKIGGTPGSRRWARLQGWKRSYSHPDTEAGDKPGYKPGDKSGDKSGGTKASARRSLFQRAFSAPSKGHEGTKPPPALQRYLRGAGRRRGHGDRGDNDTMCVTMTPWPPLHCVPSVPPLGPPAVSPVSPDVTVWDVSQFSLQDGRLVPLGRDDEVRGDTGNVTGGRGLLWKRLLRDRKTRGGSKSDTAVTPEGDRVPSRCGSHESLVPPPELDLTGDNVTIRPVHGSVVGERFCFQVITPGCSRSFGCSSLAERDRWIEELRRAARPDKDNCERQELALTLWVYEGRDLPPRRRLRCHLQLDGATFARTTAKPAGADGQLFWGELFQLAALPPARALTVALCRDDHPGQPLATVTVPLAELAAARQPLERWYTLGGAGGERAPAVRLRGRYREVRVLPIVRYKELAEFITFHYRELCGRLEPAIAVRHKEELAGALVRVLQSTGKAKVGRGWEWGVEMVRLG
uniref:RAS protein activator like 3 n=1 Tax=Catharus ustulatus TaxID=91951 RepID=A0A8C3UI34_CATUS